MIYTTKGIVLRTVKYGETSVIVNIFTELFGLQSYIVNGARSSSKTSKAHFFQSSSILEMQVYHNELKNLQRIKELKWSVLYKSILSEVSKNGIALFMVELLQKCLKQPEANTDLFYFCEVAFMELDLAKDDVAANFPIYFALQLAYFMGFSLLNNYSGQRNHFNLDEGNFTAQVSSTGNLVEADVSYHISQLLKALQPLDLREIPLNKNIRRAILKVLEHYYSFHIPEFGAMKTLPVLYELMS